MSTLFLEAVDVLGIIMNHLGGKPNIKNEAGLLSAVAQPAATVFGEDAYPYFAAKVSAVGFFLARAHALHDGNKRLGWIAMNVFVALNGAHLRFTEDDAVDVMLGVAGGEVSREDLEEWVEGRLVWPIQ